MVLAFVDQRLYAVILLTHSGDLITQLRTIADPDKISFLSDQLSPVSPG